MNIKVKIELSVLAKFEDEDDVRNAVREITDNKDNIYIYIPSDNRNSIVAVFSMNIQNQKTVIDIVATKLHAKLSKYVTSWYEFAS